MVRDDSESAPQVLNITAYRAARASDDPWDLKLSFCIHARIAGICPPLVWLGGGGDRELRDFLKDETKSGLNAARVTTVPPETLSLVAFAFLAAEQRLAKGDLTPPTLAESRAAFSSMYHLLSDTSEMGRGMRSLLEKARDILALGDFLPESCLHDPAVLASLGKLRASYDDLSRGR